MIILTIYILLKQVTWHFVAWYYLPSKIGVADKIDITNNEILNYYLQKLELILYSRNALGT